MVRTKDPEGTRERLLEAAFVEIHEHGYRAANMDRVVERSGVTRGALYHHFGSKKGLAQAMIDSMIRQLVVESFVGPLASTDDPIGAIMSCVDSKLDELTPEAVACGCPLNNLAQELSSTDADFREQIEALYARWREVFAEAFQRGQAAGTVRTDVHASEIGTFLVAVMAGSAGLAKSARDVDVARSTMRVLGGYLETLRPTAAGKIG